MIPLLASHAIQIRYTGSATTHSIVFDGGGGTGAEGLLTLNDGTAYAYDFGVAGYDTLEELVIGINSIEGFQAQRFRVPSQANREVFGAPVGDINLQAGTDTFVDLLVETVPRVWTNYLKFTNEYDTIGVGATTEITRALPISVGKHLYATLVLKIQGANAGSTGDVDFHFYAGYPSFVRGEAKGSALQAIIDGGIQDGGDNKAVLTDSNADWTVDEFVGYQIYNITDGSDGPITSNTATTITATLANGTGDDFDDDDVCVIKSRADMADADWDTAAIDNAPQTIALSAATAIRQSFTANLGGVSFLKLGKVANADPTYTCNVYAYLNIDNLN